jgi:hypothetical protein
MLDLDTIARPEPMTANGNVRTADLLYSIAKLINQATEGSGNCGASNPQATVKLRRLVAKIERLAEAVDFEVIT